MLNMINIFLAVGAITKSPSCGETSGCRDVGATKINGKARGDDDALGCLSEGKTPWKRSLEAARVGRAKKNQVEHHLEQTSRSEPVA